MQSAGFLLEYIYIYGVWNMKTTEGTAANGFTGKIDIPQLYRLKNRDKEKLVLTYLDAFDRYPAQCISGQKKKAPRTGSHSQILHGVRHDVRCRIQP